MQTSGSRLVTLDVVKALCILMIIITHVSSLSPEIRKLMLYPFTILIAVPIFIMLSAFAFQLAEEKRGGDILSWFEVKNFWRRFNRFFVPFLIAIVAIIIGLFVLKDMKSISVATTLKMILKGGRGPGSYYVIIMFQFLIIFPFIRAAFKKYPAITMTALVIAQVAFETLFRYVWDAPDSMHNFMIFRFLIHIGLGLLLYQYREKLKGTAIPAISMAIGAIYLISVYYLGYRPFLVHSSPGQSAIAALFSFGLLNYLLRLEPIASRFAKSLSPIAYVGKASFHIMLTQMVLFYFMRLFNFEQSVLVSLPLILVFDIGVSLSAGCLFFFIESSLRKMLPLKKKSNSPEAAKNVAQ